MGGAELGQALIDRGQSQFRTITIPTQVAQVNLAQISRYNFLEHIRRCFIAKVAMPAVDALFHTPGAMPILLQELDVVVSFQHEHVGTTDSLNNELCRVAQVSEKANIHAGRADEEADRILGIVRDGERFDRDIADLEGGTRAKDAAVAPALELRLESFLGEAIAVDRQLEFQSERIKAADVVGMLVRDKDGLEALRRAAKCGHPLPNLAATKTGVDQ